MDRQEHENGVRRFLAMIRQNSPRLYLPLQRNLTVEKFGPRLAVFSTYSELSDTGDSVERYWTTLSDVPFIPACGTLSAVNLVLSSGAIDRDSHSALNQTFLRNEFFKKLRSCKRKAGNNLT
jgi:hypothetical protein